MAPRAAALFSPEEHHSREMVRKAVSRVTCDVLVQSVQGGGMPFIATPGQEGSAPLSDKSVDLIMGHVNQIVKLPLFLIN